MRGICALLGKSSVLPPGPWRWLLRLNSRLSSLRNRQSVLWEMSFAGLILDQPHLVQAQGMETQCVLGTRGARVSLVRKRVASGDFPGPTRSHPALPWHLADEAAKNRIAAARAREARLLETRDTIRGWSGSMATLVRMGAYGKRCCRRTRDFSRWKIGRSLPITFR